MNQKETNKVEIKKEKKRKHDRQSNKPTSESSHPADS